MKDKIKEIDEREYKHKSSNLKEAIGVTDEEIKLYEDTMNEILYEWQNGSDETSSEVIQRITEKVPKRILAWDLYNAVHHIHELKEQFAVLKRGMEQITGKEVVIKAVEAGDEMPDGPFLTGKGGEA